MQQQLDRSQKHGCYSPLLIQYSVTVVISEIWPLKRQVALVCRLLSLGKPWLTSQLFWLLKVTLFSCSVEEGSNVVWSCTDKVSPWSRAFIYEPIKLMRCVFISGSHWQSNSRPDDSSNKCEESQVWLLERSTLAQIWCLSGKAMLVAGFVWAVGYSPRFHFCNGTAERPWYLETRQAPSEPWPLRVTERKKQATNRAVEAISSKWMFPVVETEGGNEI